MTVSTPAAAKPARWMIIAAFAIIYLVWSSSYLGIRLAVETLPPFLMSGMRFFGAGVILYAWARLRGAPAPTRIHWRSAVIAGFVLFVLNNASLVWSQAHGLPSGIAALLVATVPFWMVLLEWLRPGGRRPSASVVAGIGIGFLGLVLLMNPGSTLDFPLITVIVVLAGAFAWAFGSMYGRTAQLPESPALATAMQLLAGGAVQLIIAAVTGEAAALDWSQVSLTSVLAMIYLGLVSSIIAFTAFVWLMRVADPAKVSTYAYVNPVLAMFLGWAVAGEKLEARMLVAAAVILFAVFIINTGGRLPLRRAGRVLSSQFALERRAKHPKAA